MGRPHAARSPPADSCLHRARGLQPGAHHVGNEAAQAGHNHILQRSEGGQKGSQEAASQAHTELETHTQPFSLAQRCKQQLGELDLRGGGPGRCPLAGHP